MDEILTLPDAVDRLAELVDRVRHDGDTIYLVVDGQEVAALTPAWLVRRYEELEDESDDAIVRERLAEMDAGVVKSISAEEAEAHFDALDAADARAEQARRAL